MTLNVATNEGIKQLTTLLIGVSPLVDAFESTNKTPPGFFFKYKYNIESDTIKSIKLVHIFCLIFAQT